MVGFTGGETRGVPHSDVAERSVLGACLLHPDVVGELAQKLQPEDFYLAAHQVVFQAIIDTYTQHSHTDPIAVEQSLERSGRLEDVGGRDVILDLAGCVVSAAGVHYHAEIVREKSVQRRILETCIDISRLAYDNALEVKDLLDEAEKRIFEIARIKGDSDTQSIAQVLQTTFDRIDQLRSREGRLTGLGTGFYDLDDLTGGLQDGELIILAARPSMGKTSLALNLMERIASQQHSVLFFSLEMSNSQIIQNLLCCRAQVDGLAMRRGRITEPQYRRLQEQAENLYTVPIFVDDTPGLTAPALRGKARRLKQKHDIKMIVVDYLQLMGSGGRVESRQQEISQISRGLKALARELRVPVVALSQLNRDVENRDDHRPRMSDLRESGAIEQDADVIMMLHREEYFRPTEENAGLAQVIIAKQRNGPTGEITLRFFREFMRFENFSRRAEPLAGT